ncbi:MAG: hypothetical protein GY821_01185 [Gammaproteobacteria bacterium]|nr:hypothetical protein [Gammaproteobacteria bacterium]
MKSRESLSLELIKASFKYCGISNAIDGSEDDDIHCFKPTGPCPMGWEILKEKMKDILENDDIQVINPLEEMPENSYLSDESHNGDSEASIEI